MTIQPENIRVVPEVVTPPLDPRQRALILAVAHLLNSVAGALQAFARELKRIAED